MSNQTISPTTRSAESLFRPFQAGRFSLPGRLVMAPMTRSFSANGIPHSDSASYYANRAAHGISLIITEGVTIDHPASAGSTMVPRFFGADALSEWGKVVNAVHAAGGKIMPQLWHVGMDRNPNEGPNPEVPAVGPSGFTSPSGKIHDPLSELEIAQIIEAFAKAASQAKALGFDGIELHGAHGYLIDQFFWKVTNQRNDKWGGSIRDRTRFAYEIVKACRQAVGSDFPIILRFSQWKIVDFGARLASTPAELEVFLEPLADAGVDIFHCSTRRFWEPEFSGSTLNLAGWTRKLSGKPTITVGSIGLDSDFISLFAEGKGGRNVGIETLLERLDSNEFDLVAVGRALIADAAWGEKIRYAGNDTLTPFSKEMLMSLK